MEIPNELKEKIERIFSDDDDLRKKLLSLDLESIRFIGKMSQSGLNPIKVIEYYENGNFEAIYRIAKKKNESLPIYKELCLIYAQSETEKALKSKSKISKNKPKNNSTDLVEEKAEEQVEEQLDEER